MLIVIGRVPTENSLFSADGVRSREKVVCLTKEPLVYSKTGETDSH